MILLHFFNHKDRNIKLFRKKNLCIILFTLIVITLISGCDRDDKNAVDGFAFIFLSDTQANPEIGDYVPFGGLLELALSHESRPKLLVLGGDNVNNGNSAEEWDAFWKATGENLEDVFVASVAGNHDNSQLLAQQFDYPQTAPKKNTEGFFYTFTRSNVFFIMLDSNIMGAGNASDVEWLSEQLASSVAKEADWRIAVLHHPFWPVANVPRDTQRAEIMRDKFLPVLEEYGIDLILCGHQHVYSRTAPMRGEDISEDGIIQIMTASGAKESYTPGEKDYIEIIADTPVYLIIEVSTRMMSLTAFNTDGEPFDSIRIEK